MSRGSCSFVELSDCGLRQANNPLSIPKGLQATRLYPDLFAASVFFIRCPGQLKRPSVTSLPLAWAQELLDSNKGAALSAIVEAVRDGSTLRVLLLPSFQYVQVYLAGVQVSGWVWRFIEWLPLVSNGGYSLD